MIVTYLIKENFSYKDNNKNSNDYDNNDNDDEEHRKFSTKFSAMQTD